jgi:protein gp37
MPTTIEWTDETWNPTRGCSRVSEGCRNCYAERHAARFVNGPIGARVSANPFRGPFADFVHIVNGHPAWTGKVEPVMNRLEEPLHWKRPRRIFVNSMSDLFHEALPEATIDRVFAVMALCPQHTFQILTKRADRMLAYMAQNHGLDARRRVQDMLDPRTGSVGMNKFDGKTLRDAAYWLFDNWPLANVILGVSVEDQATAEARIRVLLTTPAAARMVSYEPALGPVDFEKCFPSGGYRDWQGLDWVIVGGESGHCARPFDIEWARSTITQCREASVACFVKQLGTRPGFQRFDGWYELHLKHRKGGDPEQWTEDIRVRQFPKIG